MKVNVKDLVRKHHHELFMVLYSILVFLIFYTLLSSNGKILGNDPAVHISKAKEMLEKGVIAASEITWYPPLYRLILAGLMVFTGSLGFEEIVVLTKILTATIDCLLVLSIYLIGSKLFRVECGVIASALLLLCFPFYEINFWGGYSSLLSLLFACVLVLYLPFETESTAHKVVIFLAAVSIVLTHQFTTFTIGIILAAYTIIALFSFRRSFSVRLLIIAVLGTLIAFSIWYLPVIIPNLDIIVTHVFFSQRQYLNLIRQVGFERYMLNFGSILFLAFIGATLSFIECRKKRALNFYTLLILSFAIPLALSQSYFFGILVPYDRFIYYALIPMVVFAASTIYLALKFVFFDISQISRVKWLVKLSSALLTIVIIVSLYVSRSPILIDKISEATSHYYSYISPPFYDAALWLRSAYPENGTVIVTEKPGLFFGLVSGKSTIMEVDPTIGRDEIAGCVLNLAYEMENPVTLFRVFEAPLPYELDQYNVLIQGIWRRASFLYSEENIVSCTVNGSQFTVKLAELPRRILWIQKGSRPSLCIQYLSEGRFIINEVVEMSDSVLWTKANWTFIPLTHDIDHLLIHLSIQFDLNLSFNLTYVPGVFEWGNPWNWPTSHGDNYRWVLTGFDTKTMPNRNIAVYDPKNKVLFAIKFLDVPNYGNIGALDSRQIDALRLFYEYENVTCPVTFTYLTINLSEESITKLRLDEFQEIFDWRGSFTVSCRDYTTFTKERNIHFLVFNRDNFRSELLNTRRLSLIYLNKNCTVCKVVHEIN
ncbi:MAG: hypothetical protein QXY46_04280 [Candidatus Bathyarchaeia archaeon]